MADGHERRGPKVLLPAACACERWLAPRHHRYPDRLLVSPRRVTRAPTAGMKSDQSEEASGYECLKQAGKRIVKQAS